MLRRVTCAAVLAARGVRVSRLGPSSVPTAASVSPLRQHRRHFSRRDEPAKSGAQKDKQAAAAAAAAAAASTTSGAAAATSAVQYFGGADTSTGDAVAGHPEGNVDPQAAAAAAASGVRTIGIKLTQDDEFVRAFNNFSKSVNGCTQEEFLVGSKQAYYSLAAVIGAFVEHVQQPVVGRTESTKTIAAAHEAAKLLDKVFKPDRRADAAMAAAATASMTEEASSSASAATASASASASASSSAPDSAASPKTRLQESLVQSVVSTITSLIPISRHLAESIFNLWILQREKQVNLSSIASSADYVLDSKLAMFARLDTARIYFNSDKVGAEVDVTLNNEYLRKLDPAVLAGATGSATSAKRDAEDDVDAGMIEVQTDTNANVLRTSPEEHTFVVNKASRKLTAAAAASDGNGNGTAEEGSKSAGTASRVQVTCVKPGDQQQQQQQPATTAVVASSPSSVSESAKVTADAKEQNGDAVDADAPSVFIKVNGNMLPPIPATARACALLTVDVVVPPERYAYSFEWFYKRIVGYENEYERIAAARVFASNSPRSLATFLDFLMRMLTGKPVEFMFSKSIGRMIGIPDDVSQTPPATRKLMCMYMDESCQWVLSDLVTLAPVVEAKLPAA